MEREAMILESFHIDPITKKIVPGMPQSLLEEVIRGPYSMYICRTCKRAFGERLTLKQHQIQYNHFVNKNPGEYQSNQPGSSNTVLIDEVRIVVPQINQILKQRRRAGPASKTGYLRDEDNNGENPDSNTAVTSESVGFENLGSSGDTLNPADPVSSNAVTTDSVNRENMGSSDAINPINVFSNTYDNPIVLSSDSDDAVSSSPLDLSCFKHSNFGSMTSAQPASISCTASSSSNAKHIVSVNVSQSDSRNPVTAAEIGQTNPAQVINACKPSWKTSADRSGSKNHPTSSATKNHSARSSSKNSGGRSISKNDAANCGSKNKDTDSGSRITVTHQPRARVLSNSHDIQVSQRRVASQANQRQRGGQNKKAYCEVCRVNLCSEKGLLQHKKTYHRRYQCACRVCGITLNTKFHLWEHEQGHQVRINGKVNSKWIWCPFCPKILASKASVRSHIQAFHTDKTCKCRYCRRILNTKYNLEEHQNNCSSVSRGVDQN